ncbi:hypothetical protein MKX01_021085 [Papaver californicum]|nr:hypothetical protein MKX01_021085 [Papaver californicum]
MSLSPPDIILSYSLKEPPSSSSSSSSLKWDQHSTCPKWKSVGKSYLRMFHDLILDWENLCTWFESEKFQVILIAQGKKSREKNTTNHYTGSKPFARYRYEMRDPEIGKEVGQIEFYNGAWKSLKAEENYGKMLELQAAPTPEGSLPLTEAQICERILSVRAGHIKGLSRGYEKPNSSSIEYNAELVEAIRRADEAEKRNMELEDDLKDRIVQ